MGNSLIVYCASKQPIVCGPLIGGLFVNKMVSKYSDYYLKCQGGPPDTCPSCCNTCCCADQSTPPGYGSCCCNTWFCWC